MSAVTSYGTAATLTLDSLPLGVLVVMIVAVVLAAIWIAR